MADVLARHGYRVHLVDEDPRTGSYNALINGIPADFKRTASRDFSPNRRKIIGRANECGTCLVAPPAEIGGRRKSINVRSLSAAFCLAAIWRFPLSEEGCHKTDPRTGSYDALINGIPADFKRTASRDFSPNRRKIIGRANECGTCLVAPPAEIGGRRKSINVRSLSAAFCLAAIWRFPLSEEGCHKTDPRTGSYDALINGIPADFKRTASRDFSPNRRKIIGRANECGTCLVAPPAEIGGRRKSINVRSLSAAFCLAAIWRFPLSEEGCHKKASINKDLYH